MIDILKGLGAIWDSHQPLFCEFSQCLLSLSLLPLILFSTCTVAVKIQLMLLSMVSALLMSESKVQPQTASLSPQLFSLWMDLVCLALLLRWGFLVFLLACLFFVFPQSLAWCLIYSRQYLKQLFR